VSLRGGPAHGHAIWSHLTSCGVEDWASVSRAQVYYSINKLAEQRLIRPAPAAKGDTQRERQTWRITPEGRRALSAALSLPHWATQRRVPPFMTWIPLAELARPAARRKTLEDRRDFLRAELAREQETLADLRRLPEDTEGGRVAVLMVEHVIQQLTLDLELLGRLERHFDIR